MNSVVEGTSEDSDEGVVILMVDKGRPNGKNGIDDIDGKRFPVLVVNVKPGNEMYVHICPIVKKLVRGPP